MNTFLKKQVFSRQSLFRSPLFRFCQNVAFPTNQLFIQPEEAAKYIDNKNVKFLDVNDLEEYKLKHIAAYTYSADMMFWYRAETSDAQGVKALKSEFQKYLRDMGVNNNDYLIAYEDSLNGRFGASCRAYYLLKLFGHDQVSILDGGLSKWEKLGLSTTSEVRELPAGDFEAKWNDSIWADREDMLKSIQKNEVLIDVRDDEEWTGESSSPLGKDFVPRKGRLQNAKWMYWKNFMHETKDGVEMNDPKQVRQQMAEQGVTDLDQPINVYCFKGARASNTFVALKNAGYTNVKNYFGSWNEWAQDSSLPIDDSKIKL